MDNTKKTKNRKKIVNTRLRVLFLCICSILAIWALLISYSWENINNIIIKNFDVKTSDGPLSGKTIIVDAGHGGRDPGTLGVTTGVCEADINLKISYNLKSELERLGASVILTRTKEDTIELGDLEKLKSDKRSKIIESANADMLLSIHQNFNEESSAVRGTQILYADENSQKIADSLQDAFNKELNRNLNCIKNNYIILQHGNQPSVIIECGFLSNIDEEKLLQTEEYQNHIIGVICKQVVNNLTN